MIRRSIEVTTQFEGLHFWAEAPEPVEFLREPHRHMFHVKLAINVQMANRELEFILVKRWLDTEVRKLFGGSQHNVGEKSCEMMAEAILKGAHEKYGDRAMTCWVSEDGENGGRIEYIPNR